MDKRTIKFGESLLHKELQRIEQQLSYGKTDLYQVRTLRDFYRANGANVVAQDKVKYVQK